MIKFTPPPRYNNIHSTWHWQQNPDLQGPPSTQRSSETICTSLSGKYQSPINYHINQQLNKNVPSFQYCRFIHTAGLHHGINFKTCAVETEFLNILKWSSSSERLNNVIVAIIRLRNTEWSCQQFRIRSVWWQDDWWIRHENVAAWGGEILDTISRETDSVQLPPPFFYRYSHIHIPLATHTYYHLWLPGRSRISNTRLPIQCMRS